MVYKSTHLGVANIRFPPSPLYKLRKSPQLIRSLCLL